MTGKRFSAGYLFMTVAQLRKACMLLGGWIFIGGVGSAVLTMTLFRLYHPDEFDGSVPTISNAASYFPGEFLFALGMGSVGLSIMAAWWLYCTYNRRNIPLDGPAWLHWANHLLLLLGLAQGFSVFCMGVFSMRIALAVHMAASYGTFISGSVAYLVDSFAVGRWRHARGLAPGRLFRARQGLALGVMMVAFFFLFMYITKDNDPLGDHYLTRLVYVTSEFSLAILSFLYAPLAGAELHASLRDEPADG